MHVHRPARVGSKARQWDAAYNVIQTLLHQKQITLAWRYVRHHQHQSPLELQLSHLHLAAAAADVDQQGFFHWLGCAQLLCHYQAGSRRQDHRSASDTLQSSESANAAAAALAECGAGSLVTAPARLRTHTTGTVEENLNESVMILFSFLYMVEYILFDKHICSL